MTEFYYSPSTGEEIKTDRPQPWMGRTQVAPPPTNPMTQYTLYSVETGKWTLYAIQQPKESIPVSVPRANGKAAILQAGLMDAVNEYIANIADPTQKALADIAMNDAAVWNRDSPFLNQVAAALNVSSAQMDKLFVTASKITF